MESVIGMNGYQVWAYVVELADGARIRVSLDEWQKMNLGVGQRILVRVGEEADVWLFITHVTELPPVVWVVTERRVRAAG
jgi:hypothetical protein